MIKKKINSGRKKFVHKLAIISKKVRAKTRNVITWVKHAETSRRTLRYSPVFFYWNRLWFYLTNKILMMREDRQVKFSSIIIETFAHCNRTCEACFNNERFPARQKGLMSEKVWEKIIGELGEIKFSGRISPHFYGEPLLDTRLTEFIKLAHRSCPYAKITVSTNGDYLTEGLLRKLIACGLMAIMITDYDNGGNKQGAELQKRYPLYVHYRKAEEVNFVNRAGMLFPGHKDRASLPCLRPSEQMVINWKGDVLLCCMDYYGVYSFGNIQSKTLKEIWNTKEFVSIRRLLAIGERTQTPLCIYCDEKPHIP